MKERSVVDISKEILENLIGIDISFNYSEKEEQEAIEIISKVITNERNVASLAEKKLEEAKDAMREIEWSNNSKWQSDRAKAFLASLESKVEG